MDNVEIADALAEVADLLELQNENPFKVRAYRSAVRTIGNVTRSLEDMVGAGADLTSLPGIGEDIAGYIAELVCTGRLERLQTLEKKLPASLVELMKLEGLGPRRARTLYDQLGVRSLAGLEKALDKGEVQRLRGFGERTAERLRRGLDALRHRPARFRLADADRIVQPLLEHLRAAPGLEHVEVAGSYRRRKETVGDLDLLAICSRPAPVMKQFTAFPDVARVEAHGRSRAAVTLRSGMRVDLRILPRRSYGAALHYFTGSKPHNIAVRRLGVERGLRISEYGIFRVPTRAGRKPRRIGGATEEEVFDAVGLPWIPPELREDRGEIDAAREGELPTVIETSDLRGDLQMHTQWSDGLDSVEDMARACRDRGYTFMAITDHSKSASVAGGLTTRELQAQWKEINRVQKQLKEIRILRGMEVDILRDGTLDLPDAWLERLDLVVVGIHSNLRMSAQAMTQRIVRALAHPRVHILAHPTGRLIGRREPCALDLEAVLQAAATYGVAIELNAQPDRLDLDDVQVRRARDLGVPIVIDTDAHSVDTLGFMHCGVDQARRGWLRREDVLNALDLSQLEAWLASRRAAARATARAPARRKQAAARRGRTARARTRRTSAA